MRWIEPRETAQARASFWKQPRIFAQVFIYPAVIPFAGFALMAAIGFRFQTGSWEWKSSLFIGAFVGLVFGFITFIDWPPSKQQEIELREHDFVIHQPSAYCTPYDQLRGYSIIHAPLGNAVHRALLLYPITNGHFSVGLPENIPDNAIHAVLSHHLPFVTIFDKQSHHITT